MRAESADRMIASLGPRANLENVLGAEFFRSIVSRNILKESSGQQNGQSTGSTPVESRGQKLRADVMSGGAEDRAGVVEIIDLT